MNNKKPDRFRSGNYSFSDNDFGKTAGEGTDWSSSTENAPKNII